jgi:hypothetical protein
VLWSEEDGSRGLQVMGTSDEQLQVIGTSDEQLRKFVLEVKGVEVKRATKKAIITNSDTLFTKSKTVSLK